MRNSNCKTPTNRRRTGFTLVELMVVITIIALLASLTLMAMFGAQELARGNKTQSMIAKLNEAIMPMYERYRDRTVPVNGSAGIGQVPPVVMHRGWAAQYTAYDSNPAVSQADRNRVKQRILARAILDARRELMRVELPDRWTDIGGLDNTGAIVPTPIVSGIPRPGLANSYFFQFTSAISKAQSTVGSTDRNEWMPVVLANQHAETLYMIISMLHDDGTELFSAGDANDVEGDGAKEFVDGWGRPISWLRWPVGYESPINRTATDAVSNLTTPAVDSFDGGVNLSPVTGTYTGHVIRFTRTKDPSLRGQFRLIWKYEADATTGKRTFNITPALPSAPQVGDRFSILSPDPHDPQRIYPGQPGSGSRPGDFWATSQPQFTFEVQPLVYSSGPDGENDLVQNLAISPSGIPGSPPHYSTQLTYGLLNNNPFVFDSSGGPSSNTLIGAYEDLSDIGSDNLVDNITNHDQTRR